MPVFGLRVLLPLGEDVTGITVTVRGEETIPLRAPLALSWAELPTGTRPSERVALPQVAFDPAQPFPRARGEHVYTGCYRGYGVAFINVYPVVYLASQGSLQCASRLEIEVRTAPSAAMLRKSFSTLRGADAPRLPALDGLVRSGEAEATYAAPPAVLAAGLADPQGQYPYVIITNEALQPAFESLREHRDRRGLRAKIVLVSDIAANYTGNDLQARIRAFVQDAYLNWETEYVLLAGDDEIIPHRGLYAVGPSAVDLDIAADLYYAALDGTWNDDNDAYWGEPLEADLMPEVSVGRAAVGDSLQAANFIAKVIRYETAPVADQAEDALMIGEALSAGTWGGDYKDEIKNGASTHGYATAGFPGNFTVGTLYDRDLPEAWDKTDLIPLLNGGRNLVNHLGHCNVTYGLRMHNADVDTSLTNDGVTASYFLLYSQGCYAGSFDNRTPSGYTEDCIGEHFTFDDNGAVAFIGNTRYGWYMPYSTNGTSQHYDRQFFDGLLGEGRVVLGEANDDARVDNIHLIDFSAMRWVYYDLVLLGDPAMSVWTAAPDSLTVVHPDLVLVSDNQVQVSVSDGAAPVEGARVSLFTDSTYSTGLTGPGGLVDLDPRALNPGRLRIAVTAPNSHAYLDSITVAGADFALLNVHQFSVDDDTLGAGSGDGDGVAEAGETVESLISIENVGPDSAFAVSALVRTLDGFVTVLDSTGVYGDIAPDSISAPAWKCAYQVSAWAPDGHQVLFEVEISSSESTLVRHHTIVLGAPELEIAGISRDDSTYGNGDGCIEPGEGIEVTLDVANLGSGDARGASFVISEADPYVSILSDSAFAETIAAEGQAQTDPPFVIQTEAGCPEFHRTDIYLTVSLANGWTAAETLAVYLGGSLTDDLEGGGPGWTHNHFNDTRADQWHLETFRNHSPGGAQAWKFGGAGSSAYSDFAHGALVTPEVCLGPNARLAFWHWIHAELHSGRYAWDGGIVEVSTDAGRTWSQVAPIGGYYYKIYPNMFSPFPGDTPCFAWTNDWTSVEFDLSAYQGPALVRFRFGSDQYAADEGWYIDDVVLSDDYASVPIPGGDLRPAPTVFALAEVSPNPVVSRLDVRFDVPRTSRVAVRVFDVTGRTVATLADSVFEPGTYLRAFDAGTALAPGVYFLHMDAAGFTATRKLVLVQ